MMSRYSVEAGQQAQKFLLFTLVGIGRAPGVDEAVGVDNEPELQCITVAENDCAQTESADHTADRVERFNLCARDVHGLGRAGNVGDDQVRASTA
jgi:hypothetical protein